MDNHLPIHTRCQQEGARLTARCAGNLSQVKSVAVKRILCHYFHYTMPGLFFQVATASLFQKVLLGCVMSSTSVVLRRLRAKHETLCSGSGGTYGAASGIWDVLHATLCELAEVAATPQNPAQFPDATLVSEWFIELCQSHLSKPVPLLFHQNIVQYTLKGLANVSDGKHSPCAVIEQRAAFLTHSGLYKLFPASISALKYVWVLRGHFAWPWSNVPVLLAADMEHVRTLPSRSESTWLQHCLLLQYVGLRMGLLRSCAVWMLTRFVQATFAVCGIEEPLWTAQAASVAVRRCCEAYHQVAATCCIRPGDGMSELLEAVVPFVQSAKDSRSFTLFVAQLAQQHVVVH